jgi:hypothetical protein
MLPVVAIEMHFIGLLTHEQKQAGYFVSQDDDFIYLWHGVNSKADSVAIFLYETATVREIRGAAERHLNIRHRE